MTIGHQPSNRKQRPARRPGADAEPWAGGRRVIGYKRKGMQMAEMTSRQWLRGDP